MQNASALTQGISSQVNLSYLMTAAKLATAHRLMALAESKLERHDEAEQTMITAMKVFKEEQLLKGLQMLYEDSKEDLDSGRNCGHAADSVLPYVLFPSSPPRPHDMDPWSQISPGVVCHSLCCSAIS